MLGDTYSGDYSVSNHEVVFSHFIVKSCRVICKYSHTHLHPDVLKIGSNTDGRFTDRKKM